MTDEQVIAELEMQCAQLQGDVDDLTRRAEEAEKLADKYREVLDSLRADAQEALR